MAIFVEGCIDIGGSLAFDGSMKISRFLYSLMGASLLAVSAHAQTNSAAEPTNAAPSAADKEKATMEKHVHPILTALHLDDQDKESKVRAAAEDYFRALRTFHAANDAQIKDLWKQFNAARSKHDTNEVAAVFGKIDGVYAGFKSDHDKFLASLGVVLTPQQVETVKDALTVNKVKVTYDVYLQIFPTLTEAQKAVVLADLKAAREEAIDCESMAEKSAFFKKYKIKIEDDYLTAQGYDPQKARKEFAAKGKEADK